LLNLKEEFKLIDLRDGKNDLEERFYIE